MHAEKLHSFVLSTLDYGDSDRIATLFSLEHGRIKVFARGAKKSRKRFGPALETFARIEAQVKVREGLSSIQQADVITVYPAIRSNLVAMAYALYACELLEVLTPEGHPLPRLFRLFSACMDHLETGRAAESDRRFFEINLLNILGYRPSLESCSRCNTLFGDVGAYLQEGGEPACRSCNSRGLQISSVALGTLAACLKTGTFGLVSISGEPLSQAASLLDAAIAAHAGRKLKSLEFLRLAAS